MSAVDALKRVRPYLQAMAALDRSLGKPDAEVLNLMSVVDQAIAHPEPVSEYDFTNVIHLTHQKAQHIIERDGFVLTGFVLTKNKEGREYAKCIVDMSAVRWFDDGMIFFRMMHAPTPLVWTVGSQSLERMAEESECVKLSLDKAGVPTADERGDEYSLWGRVRLYANQAPLSEKTKDQIHLENGWAVRNHPAYFVGRLEAFKEAAEWCESKKSYNAMHANTEFAAGIRGLKRGSPKRLSIAPVSASSRSSYRRARRCYLSALTNTTNLGTRSKTWWADTSSRIWSASIGAHLSRSGWCDMEKLAHAAQKLLHAMDYEPLGSITKAQKQLREALAEPKRRRTVPNKTNTPAADPYNGDDGPGFDHEFLAKLKAGAHLLNDEGCEAFDMGWEAAKAFFTGEGKK